MKIEFEKLTFRSYPVVGAAAAQSLSIIRASCFLWGVITTVPGAAGFTYSLYDGLDASGNLLWSGGVSTLQLTGLRIPCFTGLFLAGAGAVQQASWTFILAQVNASDLK